MDKTEHMVRHDWDLETALPYLLNRAGVRVGEAFSKELEPFGINLQMWRVLASLAHSGDRRMTDLSDHTSTEISTLSRIVDAMQRKGFVSREPAPDDGRAVIISLTEQGSALAHQIIPLANLYERVALANISAEETATLKRLLAKIYDNIAALDG